MGLIKTTPKGWSEILKIRSNLKKTEKDTMHMTGILQKIVEGGKLNIKAVAYDGIWGEVDSPNDIKFYNKNYNFG